MRLIDADELPHYNGYSYSALEIAHAVEKAPTVDAEPVKHGRWVKKKNPQWPAYSHDCCSLCGWWNTKNALSYDGNHKPGHSLNYCPNCGAKMDEVSE